MVYIERQLLISNVAAKMSFLISNNCGYRLLAASMESEHAGV